LSKLLSNIIKGALGVGVLYVAYKVGESMGKDKSDENEGKNLLEKAKSELDYEIEFITGLIKDYQEKPSKTKKDKDNLDLLKIKLQQLEKQNDNN
jgi:hypothetical protein